MKLIWCSGLAEIYAQLEEGETYVVLWFCRDLCLIGGGGQSDIGICSLFYIYRFVMKCARFGAVVLKAFMVDLGVSICHRYMCIVLIWCSGLAEIYAQLEEGETYVVLCFCRDLCLIGLGVSICHGYMCIVLYMKLIWCNGFAEIYA